MIDLIDRQVKLLFNTWGKFEEKTGLSASNGKRKIAFYIKTLNTLLKPLGYKLQIEKIEMEITDKIETENLKAEFKVLRIGKKQLTQAVFKQLIDHELWDEKLNIQYPLWGKVFYKNTLYLIFQIENILHKTKVPDLSNFGDFTFYEYMTANFLATIPDFLRSRGRGIALINEPEEIRKEQEKTYRKIGKKFKKANGKYEMDNILISYFSEPSIEGLKKDYKIYLDFYRSNLKRFENKIEYLDQIFISL